LNLPHLHNQLPNLNIIVFDTKKSNDTNRIEQHRAQNVSMNSQDEVIHHAHIANQMLHDSFEREFIHVIDEMKKIWMEVLYTMTLNHSI